MFSIRAGAESRGPRLEAISSSVQASEVGDAEGARDPDASELAAMVGRNIKRLRSRQGYSLERLAKLAGVSRAMISQIELGRSVPTIGLLWKLARALGVPFATLTSNGDTNGTVVLRSEAAKFLTSADGSYTSRALFPFDTQRRVEFYKVILAPYAAEIAAAHPIGTVENLVVLSGNLEIEVAGNSYVLGSDDAVLFEADVAHTYRNTGEEAVVMYLVMSYVEKVG